MRVLVLISSRQRQDKGDRLLQIAEWMGVPTRRIIVDGHTAIDRVLDGLGGGTPRVAIALEDLAWLREVARPDSLLNFVNRCGQLLVFSMGVASPYPDLLGWLTDGAVRGLASPTAQQQFYFPDSGRSYSRAFSGQSFTLMQPCSVSTFQSIDARACDVVEILRAESRPLFMRLARGSCELFLLSIAECPEIAAQVSDIRGAREHFASLLPLLIFLRHSFGRTCWHGHACSARLLIDDPLLNGSYGFLHYNELRRSMLSAGYGTSIAFIPWNYWRTSGKAASIFDHNPNLSICVHGCDHTNREFADTDAGTLQLKADTALRRMEKHERRTGLAFDRVMVFPQGHFSTVALNALRTNGYVAAVNSSCFPADADTGPMTLGDLLRPAITKFHGFPLFQRRYPRRVIEYALDAFLGRPLFITHHHHDFREGYEQLEQLVSTLHELEPRLSWPPLEEQLTRCCMTRSRSESSIDVRFFTRHFRFTNPQGATTLVAFSKEEPVASMVASVLIDGVPISFSVKDGILAFESQVDAGQVLDIEIVDAPRSLPPSPKRLGVTYAVGVAARRALSEIRDNAMRHYPRLLRGSTEIAKRLNVAD